MSDHVRINIRITETEDPILYARLAGMAVYQRAKYLRLLCRRGMFGVPDVATASIDAAAFSACQQSSSLAPEARTAPLGAPPPTSQRRRGAPIPIDLSESKSFRYSTE